MLLRMVKNAMVTPLSCSYAFVKKEKKEEIIIGDICVNQFLEFLLCSIHFMSISLPTPHRLECCGFLVSLKIGLCEPFSFILFKNCSDILIPLCFHRNFGTSLSISTNIKLGFLLHFH